MDSKLSITNKTLVNRNMNKAGAKTITLKVGTQFSVIKANFSNYRRVTIHGSSVRLNKLLG